MIRTTLTCLLLAAGLAAGATVKPSMPRDGSGLTPAEAAAFRAAIAAVPATRTINGQDLSDDVALEPADLGLGESAQVEFAALTLSGTGGAGVINAPWQSAAPAATAGTSDWWFNSGGDLVYGTSSATHTLAIGAHCALTLAVNLTATGMGAVTFTTSGATNLTLPTGGTVATTQTTAAAYGIAGGANLDAIAGTSTAFGRALIANAAPASAVDVASRTSWACWGDSLTFGAGNATWPYVFSTNTGYFTYNGGVSGETSSQIAARMLAATDKYAWNAAIWAGRNDPSNSISAATTKANIASMVAALGHPRYVVLGILNSSDEPTGNAALTAILALNSYLSTTYGSHYIDIRSWLISNGLSDAGISPTSQDTTDIGNNVVPSSLRADALHLNAAGYGVVARKVATVLPTIIAADSSPLTPSNVQQIINVTNSAVLPQVTAAAQVPRLFPHGILCNGQFADAVVPITAPDATAINFGTNGCSILIRLLLPAYTPAANVILVDKATANVGYRLSLLTTGVLRLQIGNGSNMTTFQYDSTAPIASLTPWSPAEVGFSLTRSSTTGLVFYVNGVPLGSAIDASAASAQTLTSAAPVYFLGNTSADSSYAVFEYGRLFNVALSPAEVARHAAGGMTGIAEYNCGVTTTYNYDFSSTTDGIVNNDSSTVTANSSIASVSAALRLQGGTDGLIGRIVPTNYPWGAGGGQRKRVRISYDYYINAGTTFVRIGSNAQYVAGTVTGTWTSVSGEIASDQVAFGVFYISGSASTADVYIKNLKITALGCALNLDATLDVPMTYQLHDFGPNADHAALDTGLTEWTQPPHSGERKVITSRLSSASISTSANTTFAFYVPPRCILREIQLNRTVATDGTTPTLDLGIANVSATSYAAALSLGSTGWVRAESSLLSPNTLSGVTTAILRRNIAGGTTTVGAFELNATFEQL